MESDWVAEKVQEDLSSLNNKSVAIIARNRKLLQPIYDKLKDKSIPVVIVQRKNEFESAQVSWLHYILRLANKRNDKKFLNKVVSNFGVLTELNINVEEVVAWSKATDGDYLRGFLNSVRDGALTDHQLLKSLEFDLVEGKDFFRFIQFCFEWLDTLFVSSDEVESILYKDEKKVWRDLEEASLLSRYDREEIALGMFLQEFDLLSKEAEPDESTVQCLTIHASKGKEFDHVYLVGMVEDELPSFQSKKKGDHSIEMEEERRNCFVAITRAKEVLTMTYSERYNGWSKQPSRFLYEMGVLQTSE